MTDILITIFTPTYNRANTIERTFNSIKAQGRNDIEWLVVDDGSTDNTYQYIMNFAKEAKFPIVYIKQENGGKHTAYNRALDLAKGELFFTVDSDDWLDDNALDKITNIKKHLKHCSNSVGIIALKKDSKNNLIGKEFPDDFKMTEVSLMHIENSGNGGERSLIFITDLVRKFKFPVIHGEKFMTESVLYDMIGKKYDFLVCNETLTICEYQEGGLSSNPQRLMALNPGGYKIYYRNRIDQASGFINRIGTIIRYNAFKKMYKGLNDISDYEGKWNLLCIFLRILNPILVAYYNRTIR